MASFFWMASSTRGRVGRFLHLGMGVAGAVHEVDGIGEDLQAAQGVAQVAQLVEFLDELVGCGQEFVDRRVEQADGHRPGRPWP
jgi:hypothetical protein